jgi:signal transduction histidine kinase
VAVSEVQLGARRLFTGIARDLTELKELEEKLVQSARLAAIGEVITGLAHESRNALQRTQACLEMLEIELVGQPEALELVRRIQNAQDHLHHLYEEVRHFAAPIQIHREPCDLAHLWRNVWSHLELQRKGKQVDLCEMTNRLDLTCDVDSFAIGQVFCNILENAITACPVQGQILIRCAAAMLGSRPAVQVALRDNGPGISAADRARVFEPFYTTKAKGTGLGMAIARRIVEAHGGTIELGDGLPRGAEFLVTLPREGP